VKNRKPKSKPLISPTEFKVLRALARKDAFTSSPEALSKLVDPHGHPSKIVKGMRGKHTADEIERAVEWDRREGPRYRGRFSSRAEKRKRTNKMLDQRHSVSCSVHKALKSLFEKKWVGRGRHEDWDDGAYYHSIWITDKGREALEAALTGSQ